MLLMKLISEQGEIQVYVDGPMDVTRFVSGHSATIEELNSSVGIYRTLTTIFVL